MEATLRKYLKKEVSAKQKEIYRQEKNKSRERARDRRIDQAKEA